MLDDDRYVIFGISNTDEQMKIRRAAERMREESIAYARISALSGEYLCIYIVDPESGRYREYRSNTGFAILAIPKEGNDFFGSSREKGGRIIYEEDRERFLAVFTKENVLEEVERSGFFTLTYRLALEAEPIYVRLKAVMLREKEGMRLIVGVSNIDAYVKQEEEYAKRLEKAHREAVIDPLTGVRNRNAYLETEEQLDRQIEEEEVSEFAIVVLDVNDLKKVNDTLGHQAGDQFICDACRIICDIFKRSPVFRIGGDEFTVVAQGDDYENVEELMQRVAEHNARANETGGIVIACGMARYENDASVAPVYERADHEMYENKNSLKSKKRNGKPKGSREKAGG